jgi:hypothetical protein
MKRPFPIYRWPPRVKPTSPSGNVEYCEGEDEPGASNHEPPAARAAKMGLPAKNDTRASRLMYKSPTGGAVACPIL